MYSYVCMYACMYVCMYACMYLCMYLCMYVCIYVRTDAGRRDAVARTPQHFAALCVSE